jgi:hypothetical protein
LKAAGSGDPSADPIDGGDDEPDGEGNEYRRFDGLECPELAEGWMVSISAGALSGPEGLLTIQSPLRSFRLCGMSGPKAMFSSTRVSVGKKRARSLYDSMVRIVVKPTWARLIDFDETLPTAVEELAAGGKSGSRPSRCPPRHTVG